MHVSVLGPLEVLDDGGAPIEVGGRQPRLMVAVLAAGGARAVPADALIDAIWGDAPPASAQGTLQSYVSRVRSRVGAAHLVHDGAGYRLAVAADDLAHVRFEREADEGRAALDAGRPGEARERLLAAEALWRGPAFGELADVAALAGVAARLDERRLVAVEDRLAAELALGRHAAVVGELTELAGAHPLREQLQARLALALYRSGRQADALRALDRAARLLREELGIEPGRELRELEAAILRHDGALDLVAPAPAVAASPRPGGPNPSTPAPAPPRPSVDLPPSAGEVAPAAPPAPSVQAGGGAGGGGAGTSPLVGRSAEREVLARVLAESSVSGRFVVIEGEPGIGKTRLADEAAAMAGAAGGWAVWGRSDEGGAAPALWPWLPPLRALHARGVDLAPVLGELVAGEVPMEVRQAAAATFETFEAIAGALAAAGRAGPVVICLDDLQWADETSLELLAHLAGRLDAGVVVVATVRQLEVGRNDAVTDALAAVARRPGSRRLVLRGLDVGATGAVLRAAAGRELGDEVASAIHGRAEGNPFYAIELARLLGEEGSLHTEVPGSVSDVIRRRLAGLPAPTVELLGVAAVAGRDVDLADLARAAGAEPAEVLERVEPAVVHRLLHEVPDTPGELRFSHALVREVLLEDLTSLRRARLHLAVADAIEARGAGVDDAEIVAEHLWRAVPVGVGSRAADALERAAEVAVSRLAYTRAEDLLDRAVQLRRAAGATVDDRAAELATLVRMLEVARAVRYFQGTPPAAIARAKELAALTGQEPRLVDVLWFECASLATAARVAEARPMVEDLLAVTGRSDDPGIRAAGVETAAVSLWGLGRITEATTLIGEAMDLLGRVPLPDDPFRAERRLVTWTFWCYLHAVTGDVPLDDVWATYDHLLSVVPDPVGRASIAGFAATTTVVLHEWGWAERFITLGSEANPSAQFGFWHGQLMMIRGILRARQGDVEGSLEAFDRGYRQYTGIGGGSGVPTFAALQGLALLDHGRLDEGRAAVALARRTIEVSGEGWNEATVLVAEGRLALAEGDVARAQQLGRQAVQAAVDQGAARHAEVLAALVDGWGAAG